MPQHRNRPARKSYHKILLAMLAATVIAFMIWSFKPQTYREDQLELRLLKIHAQVQFMDSMYQRRQEEFLLLKGGSRPPVASRQKTTNDMSPSMQALLQNMTDMHAITGLENKNRGKIFLPTGTVLLPQLVDKPDALRPAYHMKGSNKGVKDFVLGIPTVPRDKGIYVITTIKSLLDGLGDISKEDMVIVIFVGDTDLENVLRLAQKVETKFSHDVRSGFIEILSPNADYYPDLDVMQPTLGDSMKRFKWRSKQNLDAIYLMSYAREKGAMFLLLEDDVIAKRGYMSAIKEYTMETIKTNPDFIFIEFCRVGGIGKLFRSTTLTHFIVYIELFYKNMPIDWLMERFLGDNVCGVVTSSEACGKKKLEVRPRYPKNLFKHIGVFSSLRGKIHSMEEKDGKKKHPEEIIKTYLN